MSQICRSLGRVSALGAALKGSPLSFPEWGPPSSWGASSWHWAAPASGDRVIQAQRSCSSLFCVVIFRFFWFHCFAEVFLIGLLSLPRAISVCGYSSNCCFTWEDKDTLFSCWCHCIKDLFYRIYRMSFKGKIKKKLNSIKNAQRIWTLTREDIRMRSTHNCAQ